MIEAGKTYRDGYGRSVRIVATDAKHSSGPIIGLVTSSTGYELVEAYREDGTVYGHLKSNLVMTEPFVRLQDVKDALVQSGNVMAAASFIDKLAIRELPIQ